MNRCIDDYIWLHLLMIIFVDDYINRSTICIDDYMCRWLHISMITCVDDYICRWLHMSMITNIDNYICRWLYMDW